MGEINFIEDQARLSWALNNTNVASVKIDIKILGTKGLFGFSK